jgi:predicted dehydrogenase
MQEQSMDRFKRTTRRQFLTSTGFLTAGFAALGPQILTNNVLGAPGRLPASERIITGHIGVGGMGTGHLRKEAAAICDVDENHLNAAIQRVGGHAQGYKDYRKLLERKDIDAVIIATPDHWHAIMAIDAIQAGKDVYVEKPLSKTVHEGRVLVEMAERYKRVVQVGSQGRSTPAAHRAAEFIRNGYCGKVHTVETWHTPNPVGDWTPDCPPPPELDWDLWIGPAEWVPYNPKRCHFNFRWFMDFGGGNIRDRGAHVMSVILWAMDQDDAGPVRITAEGTPPPDGMFDCPTDMRVVYEFKNPDWTLVWNQPGEPKLDAGFGMEFIGDKDRLIVTGGDGGCGTEEKAMNAPIPAGGVELYKSPGHKEDWFNCIRSRERTIMHPEAGQRVATLCILGNIAYRIGRPIQWDAVRESVIGDPEAELLLNRPPRAPWRIG